MGQLAYNAENGTTVEAFSVDDTTWAEICSMPKGTWLMPRSGWAAIPKTSIRGLRFFAHHRGYTGFLPKLESYAHTRLKIDIVKAARALGYEAEIEVSGSDGQGADWIADVIVSSKNGSKFAFEVQLSSQHLQDFLKRSARYRRSGIICCWIVGEVTVGKRLSKAIAYENMDFFLSHHEYQSDLEDLLIFGVHLQNNEDYPADPPYLRFSRGKQIRKMPIEEAISGVINEYPSWSRPHWYWDKDKLPIS